MGLPSKVLGVETSTDKFWEDTVQPITVIQE